MQLLVWLEETLQPVLPEDEDGLLRYVPEFDALLLVQLDLLLQLLDLGELDVSLKPVEVLGLFSKLALEIIHLLDESYLLELRRLVAKL